MYLQKKQYLCSRFEKSMFAICYQIEDCNPEHEKEISLLLQRFEFFKHQDGFYLTNSNDLTSLFSVIEALKKIDWFRKSVRDIRAFRVEQWSDFTPKFRK